MNRCFVFCHGFGFDKDYWNNLKPYFLDDECIYIDLGYFGQTNGQTDLPKSHLHLDNIQLGNVNQTDLPKSHLHLDNIQLGNVNQTDLPLSPLMNNPKLFEGDLGEGRVRVTLIGIGHSLGLSKLIESNIKFDYLIGLNSFVNFFGNSPSLRDERSQDLTNMIERFKLSPKSTLRHFYKRCGVSISLDKLDTINESALLADLNYLQHPKELTSERPILILGSKDDGVVPPELINDNFSLSQNVTIEMSDTGRHGLGWFQSEWVAQRIMKHL